MILPYKWVQFELIGTYITKKRIRQNLGLGMMALLSQGRKGMMTQSLNELMTTVFIEQPLALRRSAK